MSLQYQRERASTIYISREVGKWLNLLAKSQSVPEEGRIITSDEIGEKILRDAIMEKHPLLLDHWKKIEKLETELVENLRKQ